MSRAFVKDDDDRPEPEIARPRSDAPNYVTQSGLRALRAALDDARRTGNERDAAYFEERLSSAIQVDAPADRGEVGFGATVRARDGRGKVLTVRIVGEDEADPRSGSLSWRSPVGDAMIGHRVGDRVVVDRPAGPIHYTIESVEYLV